jgi:predicted alpha/beta superfamily hydrolase
MNAPLSPPDVIVGPTKQTLRDVWSPQLRNRRDVDVYLPATYSSGERHPVVYMHDGQNLSDPSIAFAGTWRLEEVLASLAPQGIAPIVVGVHNTKQRLEEYSPYPDEKRRGGNGAAYLSFLIHTLKPRIDRRFRTRASPSQTAIVGSSMGGLISLYAWLRRPDVFGLAAVMSPALWFGRERLFAFVEQATLPIGRLHVDVGTAEGEATLADTRALWSVLQEKNVPDHTHVNYLEDAGAGHDEAAWGRRLRGVLEFLLRTRSADQVR